VATDLNLVREGAAEIDDPIGRGVADLGFR